MAEQRVLMRAYAESRDQTRPTIMLHGVELAIGPAGIDVNGPWGIHVGEVADGRQVEIKGHFEHAAAGSPQQGQPAAPRGRGEHVRPRADRELGPRRAARAAGAPRRPAPAGRLRVAHRGSPAAAGPPARHAACPGGRAAPPATRGGVGRAEQPRAAQDADAADARSGGKTRPPPLNARTALGYTSLSGAQSAVVRLGLSPAVSSRLGRLVDRIVPSEFHIDHAERRVLNALGEAGSMTARAIGHMLDIVDAVTFMEDLHRKLETYGLDLVEPGEPVGTEPTYRLRR